MEGMKRTGRRPAIARASSFSPADRLRSLSHCVQPQSGEHSDSKGWTASVKAFCAAVVMILKMIAWKLAVSGISPSSIEEASPPCKPQTPFPKFCESSSKHPSGRTDCSQVLPVPRRWFAGQKSKGATGVSVYLVFPSETMHTCQTSSLFLLQRTPLPLSRPFMDFLPSELLRSPVVRITKLSLNYKKKRGISIFFNETSLEQMFSLHYISYSSGSQTSLHLESPGELRGTTNAWMGTEHGRDFGTE